jgi:YD repeat-containing protein
LTPGALYQFSYNEADQLIVATRGDATTLITYDKAGRKTALDDPDLGDWSYSYDALGNLTGQTDARGCLTALTYDGLNRLTGKSYSGTAARRLRSATPTTTIMPAPGSTGAAIAPA